MNRRGFTLVELLVVIAVIAVLIGLAAPALKGAMDRARTVVCQNNSRQIVAAITAFSTIRRQAPDGGNDCGCCGQAGETRA